MTQDGKRIMEVSTDGGKVWNEVQLPAISPDRVSLNSLRISHVSRISQHRMSLV